MRVLWTTEIVDLKTRVYAGQQSESGKYLPIIDGCT